MMITDQLTGIRNQNRLGQLYDRMRIVDERLLKEDCIINNNTLYNRITIMIVLVFVCELVIMLSSYIVLIDHSEWKSLLWIISCFPTLYNSLDKIWFAVTLYALQQRFLAINNALNTLVEEHEQYKKNSGFKKDDGSKNEKKISQIARDDNLNFLCAELNRGAAGEMIKFKKAKNRINPITIVSSSLNNFNTFSAKKNSQTKLFYESQLSNVGKVEEKFNNFCQLHDELCEIGKMLNELWSYSILVLMAYGFLIFTAQLYFLYCATQGQVSNSKLYMYVLSAYICLQLINIV